MIEIKIENGTPSMSVVQLGNKYENMDEQIHFIFEEKYKNYRKYALAYLSTNIKKVNRVLPIHNDILDISNKLTGLSGEWTIYIMSREKSELDLTQNVVELSPVDGEHVDISDSFTGVVKDNLIDKDSLENEVVDNNIKIVYDEMIALKEYFDEAKKTDFYRGKSNYELAVNNGFIGTEQEFIADQKYDHSDEFVTLASQIEDNVTISTQKADEARKCATQADASKVNAAESARLAKDSEDNALNSANTAKAEADKSASSASSAQEKLTKVNETVTNFNSDYSSKIESFNTDYEAKTKTFNDNASLKNNIIDDLYHEANQVISGKVIEAAKHAETATSKSLELSSAVNKVNNFDDILNTKLTQPYVNNSGELYLNDSDDGSMRNVRLYGKYEQVKTNGYQLFDASKLPTKTMNGVTVTNNGDGSFTVTGNVTGEYFYAYTYSHEETIRLIKAGVINLKFESNTNPTFLGIFINESGMNSGIQFSKPTFQITEEMLQDETFKYRVVFYASAESSIIPGTIKPMIYQDGDGTWEPFTNGKPSPNPNYPQVVKFPGDLCQNLFNKDTVVSGWVKNDGLIASNVHSSCSDYIEIEPNTDYYIYGTYGIYTFYSTAIYDDNKTFLRNVNIPSVSGMRGVINTGADAKYLRMNVQNIYLDTAMLTKGNAFHPTYRPYSTTLQFYLEIISSSRNIFGGNALVRRIKELCPNCILNENDKTISFLCSEIDKKIIFANFKPNKKYVIVMTGYNRNDSGLSKSSNIRVCYDDNSSYTLQVGTIGNKVTTTYTTLDGRSVKELSGVWSSIGTVLYYDECGIFEYDTYDEFEKYVEQISFLNLDEPLRSLPNGVSDTIENRQVTRRIGKIVYDGSDDENYGINSYGSSLNATIFQISLSSMINVLANSGGNVLCCDKLPWKTWYGSNFNLQPSIYACNGLILIEPYDKTITTAGHLKTWLQSNPITVYYELETPVIEPLSSDNIDKLDLLNTYYPVTNIVTNVPLSFDYKLNLPSYVNMLKNELAEQKEINYNMKAKQNDLEIMQLENALETQYNLSLMKLGGI